MELPIVKVCSSEEETAELAAALSQELVNGDVITLNGELGSGKTFFVKEICAKFDIFEVSSPSFTIVNDYSGLRRIYHFDFYRIKNIRELYDLGFEEYLENTDSIIFIEWAEMFPLILPKKRIEITIKYLNPEKREFQIFRRK